MLVALTLSKITIFTQFKWSCLLTDDGDAEISGNIVFICRYAGVSFKRSVFLSFLYFSVAMSLWVLWKYLIPVTVQNIDNTSSGF